MNVCHAGIYTGCIRHKNDNSTNCCNLSIVFVLHKATFNKSNVLLSSYIPANMIHSPEYKVNHHNCQTYSKNWCLYIPRFYRAMQHTVELVNITYNIALMLIIMWLGNISRFKWGIYYIDTVDTNIYLATRLQAYKQNTACQLVASWDDDPTPVAKVYSQT